MDVGGVRRGYQVRIDREKKTSTCESDGGGEDEAGAGAVEKVPDSWVCKSEGEAELKGRLPGKTALWRVSETATQGE